MDETVIMPSPNWFQVSVMAASPDGWLVYGGPSKSLCVLEPLPADYNATIKGSSGYKAHVVNRAHPEKIVSVDLSPEWPTKKSILTGSAEGLVKQWSVTQDDGGTKIQTSLVHETHSKEKEELAGVGYSNEVYAVSVGAFGNIVKWDINSNVVKSYSEFLKNFKPNCMRCSPHAVLNVAVGTKQGVVFLIDLSGHGKILYKVRAHDEPIMNLSWCPQYEVEVKKALKEVKEAPTGLAARLEKIRNEPDEYDNIDFENNAGALIKSAKKEKDVLQKLQKSFNDSEVVQEDDMFDIYKDHEADEFGHKKYQPEDIYVKIKKEEVQSDFLAECLKLKGDILKLKTEPEPSIESLVEALDNTHVKDEKAEAKTSENGEGVVEKAESKTSENGGGDCSEKANVEKPESSPSSIHIQRHMLVTIGKNGALRIWSKTGKLVSSCTVSNSSKYQGKAPAHPSWATVLWYRPGLLLIADGKNQLVECDPTTIDCKNKLEWRVIHSLHKRGLYSITSTAPKVLLPSTKVEDWPIWTIAQERSLIQYSLQERKALSTRGTSGGFVYMVATCPYDARRVAASVGDGAVRVWEADTLEDDETALAQGHVTTYWQNVQGKVLTIAWHPTKENLLAFATAEARVGLIDTDPKSHKPAKALRPGLSSAVYGLCWGVAHELYACGGGELLVYNAKNVDDVPTPVPVELEGKSWQISEVSWTERALLVGSTEGAVAALTPARPHRLVAAAFPYTKLIHCIAWHPQQVSESSEPSPNKNLIATCALDRTGQIAVLELAESEDGNIKLSVWKTLTGHKGPVLRVAWNPHREGLLASSSQDATVRVWDVATGVCTSIFAGHSQACLGVAWSGLPSLADVVLSGGGDCALRLWRTQHHPADRYVEPKPESTKRDKKKNKQNAAQSAKELEVPDEDDEQTALAANLDKAVKGPKRFLFPTMKTEYNQNCLNLCKAMVQKYREKNGLVKSEKVTNGIENGGDSNNDKNDSIKTGSNGIENGGDKPNSNKPAEITNKIEIGGDNGEDKTTSNKSVEVANETENGDAQKREEAGCNFIKIFGSINEVNELLDAELDRHTASHNHEAWIMVSIFRGNIDSVFKYACQRDLICPFLLSLAPCVSFKYWKDVTQLYLAQVDRLVAKGEGNKLFENRYYGGPIYRKVATLLSIHDVKGAVAVLTEAHLFQEAYVLCRVRHMDSIAEETLQKWTDDRYFVGALTQAALCFLAKDNLPKAALALAKTNKEENLSLAAEIAQLSGQTTYADHIVQRNEQIKLSKETAESIEETLKDLPSRIELLLKQNGDGGN